MSNKINRRPTRQGAILREDTLPAIGLTQTEFAKILAVSPRTVSELLRECSRLTVDLAHRISRALGMSPEIWLRLQQAIDLYDLEIRNAKIYRKIHRIQTVSV